MDITQEFYNNIASQYDKLFQDWQSTIHEQAVILNRIFNDNGFDTTAHILDCACGIGTQSIGLAALGYRVSASDISAAEIIEAKERAKKNNVDIRFELADFRGLADRFSEQFDIVIAMDNALPHMLSNKDLEAAIKSITEQTKPNGIIVASIRDYDRLLEEKPSYSPPYIYKTDKGQRVCFQTWTWKNDNYHLGNISSRMSRPFKQVNLNVNTEPSVEKNSPLFLELMDVRKCNGRCQKRQAFISRLL